MYELRHLRAELSAIAAAVLAAPFGRVFCEDTLDDPEARGVPVVFVHGLFGSRVHFSALRTSLQVHGIRRFATFCYRPRFDYQALAEELGGFIDGLCDRTGEPAVDVVGHSLGGLVSRFLVENRGRRRVPRLLTLGSPYYGGRFPACEPPIFAASDLLVSPPVTKAARRWIVVPNCGHLSLLYRPAVHRRIAAYLHDRRTCTANHLPRGCGLRRVPAAPLRTSISPPPGGTGDP